MREIVIRFKIDALDKLIYSDLFLSQNRQHPNILKNSYILMYSGLFAAVAAGCLTTNAQPDYPAGRVAGCWTGRAM